MPPLNTAGMLQRLVPAYGKDKQMTNANRQTTTNALATTAWSLWIDSVGGFRVLEGDKFSIGGTGGDDPADIAVRSAWRRQLATLTRIGDDFWLQHANTSGQTDTPLPVVFNQRLPLLPTASTDHANEPQLPISKPSPLSGTVIVTVDPPHRFLMPVDAIIIAAKTILVGPEQTNHIRAPRMTIGLVMMKRADQWWIRDTQGNSQPLIDGDRLEINNLVLTLRRDDP